jgi:F-type H+-transporting ATPase subunit delta
MSISLVARRYATALLEIGSESGQLDAMNDDVTLVAAAYQSSSDLRNACENPLVAIAAKKAVIAEVCHKLGVGPVVRHTLLLLLDRRRIKTLPYVARYLRELSDAKKGVLRAEVTTATPLSEAYYEKLKAQLERMTGKKVVLEKREDPTLIAGVVTRIGDRMFDGSLKMRLTSMKDALLPRN